MDSSEVTPHMQLSDPNHMEFSLELTPTPRISPLSSSFPILHSSLDATSVESGPIVLGSPCLDQTLDDSDV